MPSTRIDDQVERLTRIAVSGAAILYGAGLVTVNAYLSQWGYSDYSQLRIRFLETGVLAVLPEIVLLPMLDQATWTKVRGFLWGSAGIRWPFRARAIGTFAVVIAATYAILRALRVMDAAPVSPAVVALALLFIHRCRGALVGKEPHTASPSRVSWAGAALLALVVSLVLFGRFIYPRVVPSVGGGRPLEVRLGVEDAARQSARHLGLLRSGTLSPPLCMLYEGDDSYLVLLNHAPTRVSKDLVATLQVQLARGKPVACV